MFTRFLAFTLCTLFAGGALAQSGTVKAIEAAGKLGRSADGPTALAALIADLGAGRVGRLVDASQSGDLRKKAARALANNQFLPHPEVADAAVTGVLEGGVVTDRLTGEELQVVSGGPSFNSGDLGGFDGWVVTLQGEFGTLDGEPAFRYTGMAPGETHSFVNGRLTPDSGNKVYIETGSGARVRIMNKKLADLMRDWRSVSYGGVGVIIPGQVVEKDGELRLLTGKDTGVPAIPRMWFLTNLEGNDWEPVSLGNGRFLYNAEVYSGNDTTVVAVGPEFDLGDERVMIYGNPVEGLDDLPRVRDRRYEDGDGESFRPGRGIRFFRAREASQGLGGSYPLYRGDFQPESTQRFTDPGCNNGFDGGLRAATSPVEEVVSVLERMSR